MHNVSSIYRSEYTKDWFYSNDVLVLKMKSPDLSIIENVWGMLIRDVYKDSRWFENTEDLGIFLLLGIKLVPRV